MSQIYIPFVCTINNITRDTTTKVFFTTTHGFVKGNLVRLYIPPQWGIVELNGLKGYVVAVSNTTITVDIDSTKFTQFSTPSVTYPVIVQQPQAIPAGDANTGYSTIVSNNKQFRINEFAPVESESLSIPGAYQGVVE